MALESSLRSAQNKQELEVTWEQEYSQSKSQAGSWSKTECPEHDFCFHFRNQVFNDCFDLGHPFRVLLNPEKTRN
jgi:hypothetical protein